MVIGEVYSEGSEVARTSESPRSSKNGLTKKKRLTFVYGYSLAPLCNYMLVSVVILLRVRIADLFKYLFDWSLSRYR